ncbi:MAG TPA: class I SAM-dependent methyltransferase [Caldimonas sp.]|jgi:SAM-dependent methyltransferase|nr:class I SAM-dependent methyltransferase [Caldimonas sp.]HEX2539860.1 class I SAM-dependent methyltransferase [Caldimonas sp.]
MQNPSRLAAEPAAGADAAWRAILDAASERYRGTDAHAMRFARAKLGNDRVFRHVLESGLVPAGAHVVDAGCGQGLFASLLRAADAVARVGGWPAAWAAAPFDVRVTGIDLLELDITRARAALGDAATFVHADMRRFNFPACDRIAFFDTLHYIAPAEQDAVLARARAALRPGGALILRVHDASAGARFRFGLWVDRVTMLLHGGGFGPLAGRPLSGWRATLEALGLQVESLPMNGRPPFANLLIVARSPAGREAGDGSAAAR